MGLCGHAVDAECLGNCCYWICCWCVSWLHGCEVENGGMAVLSDHVDIVGGRIYDDDSVSVKVDVVAGVAKLTDRDEQFIRDAWVAKGFLGVVK